MAQAAASSCRAQSHEPRLELEHRLELEPQEQQERQTVEHRLELELHLLDVRRRFEVMLRHHDL